VGERCVPRPLQEANVASKHEPCQDFTLSNLDHLHAPRFFRSDARHLSALTPAPRGQRRGFDIYSDIQTPSPCSAVHPTAPRLNIKRYRRSTADALRRYKASRSWFVRSGVAPSPSAASCCCSVLPSSPAAAAAAACSRGRSAEAATLSRSA